MDELSDALAGVRTGRPRSVRTEGRAPWGLRIHPVIGACFHVVLEGQCWLLPAGGTPINLQAGDVVFLKSGRGHGLADDPTTPLLAPEKVELEEDVSSPVAQLRIPGRGVRTVLLCGAYQADHGRTHPLLRELPDVIRLSSRVSRHPALTAAVDLLRAEVTAPRAGMHGAVPALIDVLLHYVLRAWIEEQAEGVDNGWTAALGDAAVASVLRRIHEQPGRAWTVESLAAVAGLSRAAFSRRFTKLVGEPPLTYLTRWRMTWACRLLRESDLALSGVAERVGYTSEFAFAKAFKREFGDAPGHYRRAVRLPGAGRGPLSGVR